MLFFFFCKFVVFYCEGDTVCIDSFLSKYQDALNTKTQFLHHMHSQIKNSPFPSLLFLFPAKDNRRFYWRTNMVLRKLHIYPSWLPQLIKGMTSEEDIFFLFFFFWNTVIYSKKSLWSVYEQMVGRRHFSFILSYKINRVFPHWLESHYFY